MSTSPQSRQFEFLKELARGGFGSVYLVMVHHRSGFSHIAAVKLLHSKWTDNEEISCRMRDEARLLGLLRHRNIVHVMDLTSIDDRTAIVMEHLDAVDLKTIIATLRNDGDILPVRAALEVAAATCAALDAAFNRPPHEKAEPLHVVHRDIKPSNIMVDDSGLVKVCDFGVARAEFADRESETHQLQFGSVDYMAPERLLFEAEGAPSDIYSMGCTLFEMLCGEKLGRAKRVSNDHQTFLTDRLSFMRGNRSISGRGPAALEDLMHRILAFEAAERPEAGPLAKELREFARSIQETSIAEWAEDEIPRMLQAKDATPPSGSSFVGRHIDEDVTRAHPINEEETRINSLPESLPPPETPPASANRPNLDLLPDPKSQPPPPINRPTPPQAPRPRKSSSVTRSTTAVDVFDEMLGILGNLLLPKDGPSWISIVIGPPLFFAMGLVLSSLVLMPFLQLVAWVMTLTGLGDGQSGIGDFHQRYLITGGVAFEIPLFLMLLNQTRVVYASTLARHRVLLLGLSMLLAWWATPRIDLASVIPLGLWIWMLFEVGIRGSRPSDPGD
ncbi:MAG: twin-arginine translocase subunit TatC [Myxococcota bacterium]|nr:twin-arginine translocase subunit TatC [Myxococcota bacterium]